MHRDKAEGGARCSKGLFFPRVSILSRNRQWVATGNGSYNPIICPTYAWKLQQSFGRPLHVPSFPALPSMLVIDTTSTSIRCVHSSSVHKRKNTLTRWQEAAELC